MCSAVRSSSPYNVQAIHSYGFLFVLDKIHEYGVVDEVDACPIYALAIIIIYIYILLGASVFYDIYLYIFLLFI